MKIFFLKANNFCQLMRVRWKRFIFSCDSRIRLSPSAVIYSETKIVINHGGAISVGSHTELQRNVMLMTYGGRIIIGDYTSINPFTIVYGHGNVTIGNYVLIAGGCMIIPNNHVFDDLKKPIALQGNVSKGITIEDNVWIGHGCSILDGVRIGKGAVVAAGSVVNKDIEPNSVVGGVPAKLIRMRS